MTLHKLLSHFFIAVLFFAAPVLLTGCGGGGGGGNASQAFTISGTVTDADTNLSIAGAQVSVVDVETRQNALDPFYTDATGQYSFNVPVNGTYEIRVAAQGYRPSPPQGIVGIPISDKTTYPVELKPINDGNSYGWMNLNLVDYSNDYGALVILTDKNTSEHYTGVTSIGGDLMMYNLPVGDYNITIQSVGHETYESDSNVSVSADMETLIDYIYLTPISGHMVSGTVTFLAIENGEVDVSLTDPETGAVIPGTNVQTLNTNYSIGAVAPGTYYIRATYKIDGYVVDPDRIVKFGEPEVTVVNADVPDQGIDVTGAVTLSSPIATDAGVPAEVTSTTPVLSWVDYPSTSDYVVEVVDANGDTIWGGFDENLNKLVDTVNTSIVYAGPALEDGAYYRWIVYASKDDVKEATGWKLISSSEEAQGVFKVVLPK